MSHQTAVFSLPPGHYVKIQRLQLLEVALGSPGAALLQPLIFSSISSSNTGTVVLEHVEIATECSMFYEYQSYFCKAMPLHAVQVTYNTVVIGQWRGPGVHATNVTLRCKPIPGSELQRPACLTAEANSAWSLLETIQYLQPQTDQVFVWITANMTMPKVTGSMPLPVISNVTLLGRPGVLTELDLNEQPYIFSLAANVSFTLSDLVLVNMPLGPTETYPLGLVTIPYWWMFEMDRTHKQLVIIRCTMVVSSDEFTYWEFWLSKILSQLSSFRDSAAWVTDIMYDAQGIVTPSNRQSLFAEVTRTAFADGYNYTVTTVPPRTQLMTPLSGIMLFNQHPVPLVMITPVSTPAQLLAVATQPAVTSGARHIKLTSNITLSELQLEAGSTAELAAPLRIVGSPSATIVLDVAFAPFLRPSVVNTLTFIGVTLMNIWPALHSANTNAESARDLYSLVLEYHQGRDTRPLINMQSCMYIADSIVVKQLRPLAQGADSRSAGVPQEFLDYYKGVMLTAEVLAITNTSTSFNNAKLYDMVLKNSTVSSVAPLYKHVVLMNPPATGSVTYPPWQFPGQDDSSDQVLQPWKIALIVLAGVTVASCVSGMVVYAVMAHRARAREPNVMILLEEGTDEGLTGMGGNGHTSDKGGTAARARASPAKSTGTRNPGDVFMILSSNTRGRSGAATGADGAEEPTARNSKLDLQQQIKVAINQVQQGMKDGDHLQIEEPLGAGGFGVVYRGLWRGLEVAVKTILVQHSANPRQRERIVKEVAINASLVHPNIVPIYHYDLKPLNPGTHPSPPDALYPSDTAAAYSAGGLTITGGAVELQDWKLFIIQEYCDGGTLMAAIKGGLFLVSSPCGDVPHLCSADLPIRVQAASPPSSQPLHQDSPPLPQDPPILQTQPATVRPILQRDDTAEGTRRAGLTVDMVKALMAALDIARGMFYIHSNNIIHGDLTTNNILLKRRTDQPSPIGSNVSNPLPKVKMEGGAAPSSAHRHHNSLLRSVHATNMSGRRSSFGEHATYNTQASFQTNTSFSAVGPEFSLKIADFGLSAKMDPDATHVSNRMQGTPFYIAPEILRTAQLTKASDTYSFGVVFWELLNGMLVPRTRQNLIQCSIGNGAALACMKTFPEHCPARLSALALRCLSENPQQRPMFDVILRELEAQAEEIGLPTVPPGTHRNSAAVNGRLSPAIVLNRPADTPATRAAAAAAAVAAAATALAGPGHAGAGLGPPARGLALLDRGGVLYGRQGTERAGPQYEVQADASASEGEADSVTSSVFATVGVTSMPAVHTLPTSVIPSETMNMHEHA